MKCIFSNFGAAILLSSLSPLQATASPDWNALLKQCSTSTKATFQKGESKTEVPSLTWREFTNPLQNKECQTLWVHIFDSYQKVRDNSYFPAVFKAYEQEAMFERTPSGYLIPDSQGNPIPLKDSNGKDLYEDKEIPYPVQGLTNVQVAHYLRLQDWLPQDTNQIVPLDSQIDKIVQKFLDQKYLTDESFPNVNGVTDKGIAKRYLQNFIRQSWTLHALLKGPLSSAEKARYRVSLRDYVESTNLRQPEERPKDFLDAFSKMIAATSQLSPFGPVQMNNLGKVWNHQLASFLLDRRKVEQDRLKLSEVGIPSMRLFLWDEIQTSQLTKTSQGLYNAGGQLQDLRLALNYQDTLERFWIWKTIFPSIFSESTPETTRPQVQQFWDLYNQPFFKMLRDQDDGIYSNETALKPNMMDLNLAFAMYAPIRNLGVLFFLMSKGKPAPHQPVEAPKLNFLGKAWMGLQVGYFSYVILANLYSALFQPQADFAEPQSASIDMASSRIMYRTDPSSKTLRFFYGDLNLIIDPYKHEMVEAPKGPIFFNIPWEVN